MAITNNEAGRASPRGRLETALLAALLFFVIQSVYLAAYATPDLIYPANVLLHSLGGAALLVPFAIWAWRRLLSNSPDGLGARWTGRIGSLALALSGVFAIVLMVLGNIAPYRWLLYAHIAAAVPAAALLLTYVGMRIRASQAPPERRAALAALGLTFIVAPTLVAFRLAENDSDYVIRNPSTPPSTMNDESMGGKAGPFFPSSAKTSTGGKIKSTFFMTSETCGQSGCHPDITEQWRSSMHRHSSFNNQWYRKSIEYMQSVNGIESSKWCAGCHDLAVLFNGMFDQPVSELIHTPEANVGLACTACHSITHVGSTMGQGDYYIEYPPLHDLAVSDNFFLKLGHDLSVRFDPEPHSKTFLKPFHSEQRSEFCSSCHKVHLDIPVNNYRWFRGFNEYDNWQGSGVSGMGARSFYYPPKPKDCADCHMPLVPSNDKGNDKGFVHSHRFPGANTAVPFVNGDTKQLEAVKDFLHKQVTLDIFALSNQGPGDVAGKVIAHTEEPRQASTFAVGEEGGGAVGGGGFIRAEPVSVTAPLDGATVRRGDSLRLDVVVRTRGVGHFFPGGTVDAFETWVELKGVDSNGRTIFWSGAITDEGKGPVEPGAHFYRAFLLDAQGNKINKRNAWAARSALYVRLIPPGAADTVHFRLDVPADCGDEIQLTARLNYRKFSWYNTNWAYAGIPDPAHPEATFDKSYDNRPFVFTGDTSDVSGKLKAIPDLPIIEIDRAHAKLRVVDAGMEAPAPPPATTAAPARERWNDYGIGLLLQGDLRAALHAFEKVTEIEPGYVDGWVNIARTRLREGETQTAREALARALQIDPKLARAHYFEGVALKTQGDYDGALRHLLETARQYPKDRVVLNDIARVYFLRKEFARTIEWGQKVMAIDPEDLSAHYNMMLAYRGLGDAAAAGREKAFYERFKADEDSQILTGAYRRANPEDNNERQSVHEHVTISLTGAGAAAVTTTEVTR